MLPKHMLLDEVDERGAQMLLQDPNVLMEPKFDGDRTHLFLHPDKVFGLSRSQKPMAIAPAVIAAGKQLVRALNQSMIVLDGEQMNNEYFVVFDLLQLGGLEAWQATAEQRAQLLRKFRFGQSILPTKVAYSTEEKTQMYRSLWLKGAEGAVFKNKHAPYKAGKDTGVAFKRKWANDATVISGGPTKRSSFYMLTIEGDDLGTCTVSGNKGMPPTNSLVDVRYQNRTKDGKLYQPRMLRLRTDLSISAASNTQLYTKGTPRV